MIRVMEDSIFDNLKDINTGTFQRLEAELRSFQESVNFLSGKLCEIAINFIEIKEEFEICKNQMESLLKENKTLWYQVMFLHGQLNDLQQYSRSTNLEICGLPETPGEDIVVLVDAIAQAIGVERRAQDILTAKRVFTKSTKRPKPIIVKLRSKTERINWIVAFRKKRNLTCLDINPHFPQENVYINEHLTSYNKELLFKTKRFARDCNYDFSWVSNGKIFLRKNSDSPVIQIFSPGDLQWLEAKSKNGYKKTR